MSQNNHINGPIKEDDEINPNFYEFPDQENHNIENFQEFVDNMEEFPQNLNFGDFANINQVEQNETQNEIQNEFQNELNETKDKTHNVQNGQNWQTEQNETQYILIPSSNLEEIEGKKEEEKEANEEKNIPKNEGSSMSFLNRKRNSE